MRVDAPPIIVDKSNLFLSIISALANKKALENNGKYNNRVKTQRETKVKKEGGLRKLVHGIRNSGYDPKPPTNS